MSGSQTSYPKEKIKVLLLENISPTAIQNFNLGGYFQVETLKAALNEEDLCKKLSDVHLLGIRSKTTITEKVLSFAPKLQAIGCFCIGVNQVDLDAANHRGVAVFNAPYSNTRSVAELVIGAAIMLMRRVPGKNKAAHEGKWLKQAEGSYEVRGKVLGIIGYGNIGSQVSVLAEGLGMNVIYYDIETRLPLGNARNAGTLTELLKASDIITLHVPETAITANLINASNLSLCRRGAVLINYSRGNVVNLEDLRDFLEDGRIGGAAIDVFPDEPEKAEDPFRTPVQGIDNVLLTPHIGGSTLEAQENIGVDVSSKLLNFLDKGVTLGSHTVPALSLPPQEKSHRILHIHENKPGVLSQINRALSENGINILGQYLKTNDLIGYVVVDVDKELSSKAAGLLGEVPGSIRVRLLY